MADEHDEDYLSASDWSDETVAKTVRHVLFELTSSDDAYNERDELESIQSRTEIAVLQVLRDTTLYKRLVTPTVNETASESPLERACVLLGDEPSEAVIEPLTRFLSDDQPGNRACAVCSIAKTGAVAAVPAVRQAFEDSASSVHQHAIDGLALAVRDQRLSPAAVPDLFDSLCQLLQRGHEGFDGAELLFKLDEPRATAYCLSEQVFSKDCNFLDDAIRELHERRVPAPRERLLAILDELETESHSNYDSRLVYALPWLGSLRNPDDRPRLETYLALEQEWIAAAAAEGMLESHGLQDVYGDILNKAPDEGFAGLTDVERHYYALDVFLDEMEEEGFANYGFHFPPVHWQEVQAALEAMRSRKLLPIVRKFVALFPKNAPLATFDERGDQIDNLTESDPDCFARLDEEFFASTEFVKVLLMRYVLEHADEFK